MGITLNLRKMNGQISIIQTNLSSSVWDLKCELHTDYAVSAFRLKLVYGKRVLTPDSWELREFGVVPECELSLIFYEPTHDELDLLYMYAGGEWASLSAGDLVFDPNLFCGLCQKLKSNLIAA